MSDGNPERQRHEVELQAAASALEVIDRMISGDPDAVLSVTDLGWLRAMLLDRVEIAEAALGLETSETLESLQRTISLGLNAGILSAIEAQEESAQQHLPTVENRDQPGVHWMLHMSCPECDQPGVEQTGPDDGDGDHRAVTVHPDRDEYDSPIGTRGGYTQIDLWCPDGHQFALIIANHKGDEYIGAVAAERVRGQAR